MVPFAALVALLLAIGVAIVLAARVARRSARDAALAADVVMSQVQAAMQLLPPIMSRTSAILTDADFPGPATLVVGMEDNCKAPDPQEAAEAVRKAEGEKAWLASLPFAMDRYFRVMAEAPCALFQLEIEITLVDPDRRPSVDVMEGVAHGHDIDAVVVVPRGAGPITILSGKDAIALGGYFPYTVRRIAPYVHGLVDKVLLPLHRSHPIARVSLTR